MKTLTFGSALAIAIACAATSVYAKPNGHSPTGHVHGITVTGNNITETVVEKGRINIAKVSIVGNDDTVTVEQIGKINSIVSSIVGSGDTVVGIQFGLKNSFSSVAIGDCNTAVAVQLGRVSNVSHITQYGNFETAIVVQGGPNNFSSIVQGPKSDPPPSDPPPVASNLAGPRGGLWCHSRTGACF